jgi:hypothetical protein
MSAKVGFTAKNRQAHSLTGETNVRGSMIYRRWELEMRRIAQLFLALARSRISTTTQVT